MKEILSVSVVITKFITGLVIITSMVMPIFMAVISIIYVMAMSIMGRNPFVESEIVQMWFPCSFGVIYMFVHYAKTTSNSQKNFLYYWLNFEKRAEV